MIVAGNVSAGAEVIHTDVPILPLARLVGGDKWSAIRGARGPLWTVRTSLAYIEINTRDVVMLADVVGEMIELITEFEVMCALPSAFVPR